MTSSRWVRWAVGAGLAVGVVLASAGAAAAAGSDGPEVRRATERGVRERALEDAPGSAVAPSSATVLGFQLLVSSGSLYQGSTEQDVVVGPDDRVWASGYQRDANYGTNEYDLVRAVAVPPGLTSPKVNLGIRTGRGHGLAVGPDGEVWFIGPAGIGRVTPSLEVVHPGFGVPGRMTTGPDGNLWFVTFGPDSVVGRLDPATGLVAVIGGAGLVYAEEIVSGPDGNLWVTSGGNDRIVRVSPQGQVVSFASPSIDRPWGLAVGADGNLWFASANNDRVGRITPAGVLTTFTDPAGRMDRPVGVVAAPDGYLYVTSEASQRLTVVATDGAMRTLELPTKSGVGPSAIAADAANLYYVRGDTVVRVFATPEPVVTNLTATTPSFGSVRVDWDPPSESRSVLGYNVYRDGALWTALGASASTVTDVPETVPGVVHEYQVAVVHSNGEGPRATVQGAAAATGSLTAWLDGGEGVDPLSADVGFTGCAAAPNACGAEFFLDDHSDPTLPDRVTGTGITPGTYTITLSTLPSGYYLRSASCIGATASVDFTIRRLTVSFGSSRTVVSCSFTVLPTNVTVQLAANGSIPTAIGFEGCGPTASTCSTFSLDRDSATVTPSSVSAERVPNGTYQITLTDLPAGITLVSISCSDTATGVTDLANRRATVTIGTTNTCTFQIDTTSVRALVRGPTGSTLPAVGLTRCGPTPSACESLSLDTDPATPLVDSDYWRRLEPGAHTVTVTALPPGWSLTSIGCNAGSPSVDLDGRSVTVTLAQNADTLCTFTLSPLAGVSAAVDTPLGMRADVGFTLCGPSPSTCEAFALDDDGGLHPPTDPSTLPDRRSFTSLAAGAYTLTLTGLPANAVLDAIECGPGATVDLANRRVHFDVDGVSDDVGCTFRVSGPGLELVVSGTAADVGFEVCFPGGAGCVGYVLDDDGNATPHLNRRGESGLAAGSYVMRLADLPAGTTFQGVACVGPGATVDNANRTVTVALTTQTVSCTFTVTG